LAEVSASRYIPEQKAVLGTRYRIWDIDRDGWPDWNEPTYMARHAFTVDYVKSHGVHCTGLENQANGRLGISFRGGVALYFDYLENKRRITETELGRGVPVGIAAMSDYTGPALQDQGHIVTIVSKKDKNGQQRVIQADLQGGVNQFRTLRESIRLFGLTHFGKLPGVKPLPLGQNDSDEPPQSDWNPDHFIPLDLIACMRAGGWNLPKEKAYLYYPYLNAAMQYAQINTYDRARHFLAQIGHESASLNAWKEIGGENAWYAPYYGRGPIQLTLRDNYAHFGSVFDVDLLRFPNRAMDLDLGFMIAAQYWRERDLNRFADANDFDTITYRINGGYNGYADRRDRLAIASRVLSPNFKIGGTVNFRKIILAAASHDDNQLVAEAYKALHRAGLSSSPVDGESIAVANAVCWMEPVESREFVVVGNNAKAALPYEVREYIGKPVNESDYRDAVGRTSAETRTKLGECLADIRERQGIEEPVHDWFLQATK
jgi:predicted chitinase